jgi:hypothetical protein
LRHIQFDDPRQPGAQKSKSAADDQSHTDVPSEGLTQFDLDVGEARFKRLFCTEIEPLFDTFRPLTARGSIAALGYRLKSKIKRSPAIWDASPYFADDQSHCAGPPAGGDHNSQPQAAATCAPE